MKVTIKKEVITEALQSVTGVVEKRHAAPILANVRMQTSNTDLTITATDNEVELTTRLEGISPEEEGTITAPARKLLELCRSLPDRTELMLQQQDGRLYLESGEFKSHLSTLPADDFPLAPVENDVLSLEVSATQLKQMLDRTAFAMAQQDVRYFFNGMLFDIKGNQLRLVATNGQRLATSVLDFPLDSEGSFIVPRKGVNEILRMIGSRDETVSLAFGTNHVRLETKNTRVVSKLIDGSFPDYQVAIPTSGDKVMEVSRSLLREALIRAAILSNEMYRNVKLHLAGHRLGILANNPMKEDAEEKLTVSYDGAELEIGFNVGYLIDCLTAMEGDTVRLTFSDGSSAVLIEGPDDPGATYVISPMVI